MASAKILIFFFFFAFWFLVTKTCFQQNKVKRNKKKIYFRQTYRRTNDCAAETKKNKETLNNKNKEPENVKRKGIYF